MKIRITNTSDRKAIEGFLVELANVRLDAVERLLAKFPNVFPAEVSPEQLSLLGKLVGKRTLQLFSDNVGDRPRKEFLVYVLVVSRNLRSLWDAPDWQTASWRWFWLRIFGARIEGYEPDPSEPPPTTPFEVCMLYLWANLKDAIHCGNPECTTPYFFRKKKGQQYCSDLCAEHGQREAKKRWWSERENAGDENMGGSDEKQRRVSLEVCREE